MSKEVSITGTIKLIEDTVEVSEKFKKRGFVVETADQYPQTVYLETHQDNVSILDNVAEGEHVTAHLNIRGREWVNPEGVSKFFNTLVCWRLESGAADNSEDARVEVDVMMDNAFGGDENPFD